MMFHRAIFGGVGERNRHRDRRESPRISRRRLPQSSPVRRSTRPRTVYRGGGMRKITAARNAARTSAGNPVQPGLCIRQPYQSNINQDEKRSPEPSRAGWRLAARRREVRNARRPCPRAGALRCTLLPDLASVGCGKAARFLDSHLLTKSPKQINGDTGQSENEQQDWAGSSVAGIA